MRKTTRSNNIRRQEQDRVVNFLRDQSGGSIIIAGDRGSGKTTLVEESMAEHYKETRRTFRRPWFHNQIVLRVPLILHIPSEGTSKGVDYQAQYRSLLLRTIARSMESELLDRRLHWLDLPMRWFRSIGYVQAVQRLTPLVNSTSIEKSLVANGALSSKSHVGVSRAISYAIDISDAVIEMRLRDVLHTHSRQNNIIIVIDELDKLEDNNIKPEEIIKLLKNLFSETGVHAIFISNEPTINRILSKIASEPFCAEHTLFKDKILLNQYSPSELEIHLSDFLKGLDNNDKRQAIGAISLMSRLMPFDVTQLIRRLDFEVKDMRILDKLQQELGSFSYLYESPLHLFVNHVYSQYSPERSQLHNRVLYRSLLEAANNLFNQEVSFINWEDPFSIFYTSNLFHTPESEEHEKGSSYSSTEAPEIIKKHINTLNPVERSNVSSAVLRLIALLDRAGFLDLRIHSGSTILKYGRFHGDTFTTNNINKDLDSYLDTTSNERQLVNSLNEIAPLYNRLFNTSIETPLSPVTQSIGGSTFEPLDGKNESRPLKTFWRHLERTITEGQKKVIEKISQLIASQFSQAMQTNYRSRSLTREILKGSRGVKFSLNNKHTYVYVGSYPKTPPADADKIYFIQPGITGKMPFRTSKAKRLNAKSDWSQIDESINTISDHLTSLIKSK